MNSENNLSNMARVKVSEEIMLAAQKPLTSKRRRELRRERIKAYIKSRPYGTRIRLKDFQEVTGMKTDAAMHAFLRAMIRDNEIVRHSISLRTYFYVVPEGEARLLVPGKPPEIADSPPPPPPVPELPAPTPNDLEHKAMHFSWENPEYNNDLRRFITWLDKLEKP